MIEADEIIKIVRDIMKFDPREKSRKRETVYAKFMATFFIKENTNLTIKKIGDLLGVHYTSILHYLKRYGDVIETDVYFLNQACHIYERIQSKTGITIS